MIREKLEEAMAKKDLEIQAKKNDINTYIWKGRKVEVNGEFKQTEIKLVDCTQEQLQSFYDHCETMLYNTDKDHPGRCTLLKIVEDQITRCNAELFIRYMAEEPRSMPRFILRGNLRTILNNNPQVDPNVDTVDLLFGGCPDEFKTLPINLVMDGCLDKLGRFDRKHITLTFILKQGLWLTPTESSELSKYQATNNYPDKETAALYYMGLRKPTITLKMNSKGISLTQMKSMIKLRSTTYSELSTTQLQVLRNRMLYTLEDEINFHIKQWKNREEQILKVAESKGYTLNVAS